MKVTAKNFISLFILKFFQIGTNFILLPFLIRRLGAEGYGHITFANNIIVYFTILVTFGFNYSSVQAIATYRTNNDEIKKIVNTVLSAKIYLLIISAIIIFILSFIFSSISKDILLIYCYFLLVIGDSIFPQFFFQGIQQMDKISIINIGIKLLGLLLIILFVKTPNELILVPLLIGLSSLIGGYWGYHIMKKELANYKFRLMGITPIKQALINSTPYFLVNIAATLKDRTSSVIIATCISYSLASYYEIAQKVVLFMSTGIGILGQVFYPVFASNINKQKERKIFFLFSSSGFILCIFLIIFSKLIYKTLAGESSIQYYALINILSLSLIFLSISTFLGTLKIGAAGKGKTFSKGVFGGVFIYFLGLLLLYCTHNISIYTLSWLYVVANCTEMICFILLEKHATLQPLR